MFVNAIELVASQLDMALDTEKYSTPRTHNNYKGSGAPAQKRVPREWLSEDMTALPSAHLDASQPSTSSLAAVTSSKSTPDSQGDELTIVTPLPGIVLKTKSKPEDEKVFINLCHHSVVPKSLSAQGTNDSAALQVLTACS